MTKRNDSADEAAAAIRELSEGLRVSCDEAARQPSPELLAALANRLVRAANFSMRLRESLIGRR